MWGAGGSTGCPLEGPLVCANGVNWGVATGNGVDAGGNSAISQGRHESRVNRDSRTETIKQ